MLELRGLKKTYVSDKGTDCVALNNVNLAFGNSGLVFILGRSGSGKSTLMNAIGGLDSTDEGEIIINGTSNKDFTDKDFDSFRNTHIGFIFQEYNLMPEFNVYDNVALATELQNRKVDKTAILSLISEIGLDGLAKRKISELSGGQKQRVSIARALSKNPNIILADEPTGNLDKRTSDQIFTILKELSKTKLIIVVTHDHESASRFGDRIITFSDGKIANDTQNYLTNFASPFLKNSVKAPPEKLVLKQAKLPKKTAFRIALSSVLSKKIRLIFTVLLVVIAVSIFGFGQVIGNYDVQQSSIYTMENIGETTILIRKGSLDSTYGTPEYDFDYINDATLAYIQETYPQFEYSEMITLNGYDYYVSAGVNNDYLNEPIGGFIVSSVEKLANMGYDFYGDYPVYDNELALNETIAFLLMCYSPETLGGVLGSDLADSLIYLILLDMVFSLDEDILLTNYGLTYLTLIEQLGAVFNDDAANADALFDNAELCSYVFSAFPTSFLRYVDSIYIEGSYYDITGICSNNLGEILPSVLNDDISVDNITMEQYTYLYNFENIYTYIFVGETFADTYVGDGAQMKSFYASKTVQNGDTNMLQNVMIKCNAQWLARNPYIGEPIVIDGETYVIVTGEINLNDDEMIVSSTYFDNSYGDIDDFDTSLDLRSSSYKYKAQLSFSNSKLSSTKKTSKIKIVGVFDYYAAVADYTAESKYDTVAEADRGYISIDMGTVVFVSDNVCETYTDVLTLTGTLWGNTFGDNDEQLAFWADVGSFEEGGLMLYHANSTSDAVYTIYNYLAIAKTIFTLIGYLMGVFSIALLCNFMSVSVLGKKREIGILRALGSRKVDILKIFMYESFMICIATTFFTILGIIGLTYAVNAIICYALSVFLNSAVIGSIAILTLSSLPFIFSTLIIACIISLATAIPVLKISNMKPIDAIKS